MGVYSLLKGLWTMSLRSSGWFFVLYSFFGFDMNYNEDAKSLMNRRGSEVSQEIEAALGLYRVRWGSLRVLLWLCFNVEA